MTLPSMVYCAWALKSLTPDVAWMLTKTLAQYQPFSYTAVTNLLKNEATTQAMRQHLFDHGLPGAAACLLEEKSFSYIDLKDKPDAYIIEVLGYVDGAVPGVEKLWDEARPQVLDAIIDLFKTSHYSGANDKKLEKLFIDHMVQKVNTGTRTLADVYDQEICNVPQLAHLIAEKLGTPQAYFWGLYAGDAMFPRKLFAKALRRSSTLDKATAAKYGVTKNILEGYLGFVSLRAQDFASSPQESLKFFKLIYKVAVELGASKHFVNNTKDTVEDFQEQVDTLKKRTAGETQTVELSTGAPSVQVIPADKVFYFLAAPGGDVTESVNFAEYTPEIFGQDLKSKLGLLLQQNIGRPVECVGNIFTRLSSALSIEQYLTYVQAALLSDAPAFHAYCDFGIILKGVDKKLYENMLLNYAASTPPRGRFKVARFFPEVTGMLPWEDANFSGVCEHVVAFLEENLEGSTEKWDIFGVVAQTHTGTVSELVQKVNTLQK